MKQYVNVGTKGHIDYELPKVLVVGGISKASKGLYEALKQMEDSNQIEIVYQDSLDSSTTEQKIILDECLDISGDTFKLSLQHTLTTQNTHVTNKHQKPWYRKGRW